jgi:hypothetical protein
MACPADTRTIGGAPDDVSMCKQYSDKFQIVIGYDDEMNKRKDLRTMAGVSDELCASYAEMKKQVGAKTRLPIICFVVPPDCADMSFTADVVDPFVLKLGPPL